MLIIAHILFFAIPVEEKSMNFFLLFFKIGHPSGDDQPHRAGDQLDMYLVGEQRLAVHVDHVFLRKINLQGIPLEMDDIFNIDLEQFGFEPIDEEIAEEVVNQKPEVEFTEVLGEENNYLVLKFTTEVDWLQALSVFEVKQVKALPTRKDGKVTDKMMRIGVGRVLDGAKALNKLVGDV